jgi:hypothetical protein
VWYDSWREDKSSRDKGIERNMRDWLLEAIKKES